MTKIVEIALHFPEANHDEEPCSNCKTGKGPQCTCDRARIWWDNFAKQFKKGR